MVEKLLGLQGLLHRASFFNLDQVIDGKFQLGEDVALQMPGHEVGAHPVLQLAVAAGAFVDPDLPGRFVGPLY